MTQTNADRASLVSRQVELTSVTLASARLDATIDPIAPPAELDVGQQYRASYSLRTDQLRVTVEFRFTATSAEEDEAVSLEASYLLVYSLHNAAEYPGDALEHFSGLNGPYNAWPYWRELVQTVTGRTGLTGILVPVFRPPIRPLSEEEREQLELSGLERDID